MSPANKKEFEKLSKAEQEWTLEVLRLLGLLTEEQQQAAIDLARTMEGCNAVKAEVPV